MRNLWEYTSDTFFRLVKKISDKSSVTENWFEKCIFFISLKYNQLTVVDKLSFTTTIMYYELGKLSN